ncbi:hypothetical protein [Streptomyces cinereoruber]|uniref:hypothetical protein n=1 Tax=Streptomyces cinereoruber TaxID=67260 RepID=UPI003C2BF50D
MEAHNRGSTQVSWTRPTAPNFVVSLTLGYLLYQQPTILRRVAAGVGITMLGWIRVTRTV